MGIRGMGRIMEAFRRPEDLVQSVPLKVPGLAIDFNEILHQALRRTRFGPHDTYSDFVDTVAIKSIIKLFAIQSCVRTENIGVFMDGVAPYAKLELQAKRRKGAGTLKKAGVAPKYWITSGTMPMQEIGERVAEAFPDWHFKDSTEPGEGEYSIIPWMHSVMKTRQDEPNFTLVGGDSDLYLIAACSAHKHKNLSVMSSGLKFWPSLTQLNKMVQSGADANLQQRFTSVDIDSVLEQAGWTGRGWDFSAIVMMSRGNDFVHPLALHLGRRGLMLQPNFQRPIIVLNERGDLSVDGLLAWFQAFQQCWIGVPIDPNKDQQTPPEEFFQSVAWSMALHISGEPPATDFFGPKVLDDNGVSGVKCFEYLKKLKALGVQSISAPHTSTPWHSVDEALLLLIPRAGRDILPKHLQPAMDSDELAEYFPQPCQKCQKLRTNLMLASDAYTEAVAKYNDERPTEEKMTTGRLKQEFPLARLKSEPNRDITKLHRLREKRNSIGFVLERHQEQDHPKKEFPVDKIKSWLSKNPPLETRTLRPNPDPDIHHGRDVGFGSLAQCLERVPIPPHLTAVLSKDIHWSPGPERPKRKKKEFSKPAPKPWEEESLELEDWRLRPKALAKASTKAKKAWRHPKAKAGGSHRSGSQQSQKQKQKKVKPTVTATPANGED